MTTTSSLTERDVLVRDVLHGLYEAWRANDADAFAAFYTDDATAVLPGHYNRTRAEIRSYMSAGFAGPLHGSSVLSDIKSIRFLGDRSAVVIDEGGVLMAGEDILPPGRAVRATWLLTQHEGQWLVAAYHNSPQ